jgi:hypothetical protein
MRLRDLDGDMLERVLVALNKTELQRAWEEQVLRKASEELKLAAAA